MILTILSYIQTFFSFIVVLSVLVFVHELGHYLAARHVGVRVEQFSIGFPPRLIGRKWGETEYLLSWVPLGGYVRLFGQNLDDENPDDPRNYAAKSVWQRLYILLAGPAANLLLALLVMPAVYAIGVDLPGYRNAPAWIAGVEEGSAAQRAGFQPGDRILRVGGEDTQSWNDVYSRLESQASESDAIPFVVERAGGPSELPVPIAAFGKTSGFGWIPKIESVAGRIAPGTPAEKAGLQPGDRILAVNGTAIGRWEEISKEIQKSAGKEMVLHVERAGATIDVPITAQLQGDTGNYLIGISPPMQRERHGPIDAFLLGTARLWDITRTTFVFLGRCLTGHCSMDQIGGPVKIGAFIGEAARTSASSLAFLMAIISLQLGIFNLLPIPALDGGHIFYFLLPEVVHVRLRWARLALRKRIVSLPIPHLVYWTPLRPRLRAQIQTVGMTLLLLLMVFVTYKDILSLLS